MTHAPSRHRRRWSGRAGPRHRTRSARHHVLRGGALHQAAERIPKGQNLTQRTMEHVHHWGAEAALRAARTIPASLRHRRPDGVRHAAGRLPLRLAAAGIGAAVLLHRQ